MSNNVTRGYGLLEGFLARKRCEVANSLIPKEARSGRVLDVGCGSHPFFLLNTEFFEKYGIDQLVKQNDRDKFEAEKIKLMSFDINKNIKLPFGDENFNAVIMLAVTEHLEKKDLLTLLKEIYRVLKKDGVFVYTTPIPQSDMILKIMARLKFVSHSEIEEHKEYYDHKKMKDMMTSSGFDQSKMKFGYFEFKFNTWGVATK